MLFSQSVDTLALLINLIDLEDQQWRKSTDAISNEVSDIMVDVVVIFLGLPPLKPSQQAAEPWHAAFELLFELVRGLRGMFNKEPQLEELPLEGRPGRVYTGMEREYFVACFFEEFYGLLSTLGTLGPLQTDAMFNDPVDDSIAIYDYVKSHREHTDRRRKDRRASSKDFALPLHKAESKGSAARQEVRGYLDSLVAVGLTESLVENLMQIAKRLDAAELAVDRFFHLFRKQEFFKLYSPVQNTPVGDALVDVLALYYVEYSAGSRAFNAPTYETVVRDVKRRRLVGHGKDDATH